MDKHTYTERIRHALISHGLLLSALAMAAVLGTVLPSIDIAPKAHFLQTRPAQTEKIATSTRAKPKPAVTLRDQRLQKRIVKLQHPVVRQNIVAQAEKNRPYLITEENTHAAAPQTTVVAQQASSSVRLLAQSSFPAFSHAVHPVPEVPNWGAMTSPMQWNRTMADMDDDDFVRVPSYNLENLTIPLNELLEDRMSDKSIRTLTAKLYYSTRFFGAYDLDADEFTSVHPGIDLKLALGAEVGAVAGGRVHDVRVQDEGLGRYVIVEHRAPGGKAYYSIYGHLDEILVTKGQDVIPGQTIGTVGMTGSTTGPHLHLQIDRGTAGEAAHGVYWPAAVPSPAEADKHTINPIEFIRLYAVPA